MDMEQPNNLAQKITTRHPMKKINPWKKANKNKQEELAKDLNFGIQDKYKIGDQVLYLSFGTTLENSNDYNRYYISPGIIQEISRSQIDGATRYRIKGYDWPSQTSTKKYIKLNA